MLRRNVPRNVSRDTAQPFLAAWRGFGANGRDCTRVIDAVLRVTNEDSPS